MRVKLSKRIVGGWNYFEICLKRKEYYEVKQNIVYIYDWKKFLKSRKDYGKNINGVALPNLLIMMQWIRRLVEKCF